MVMSLLRLLMLFWEGKFITIVEFCLWRVVYFCGIGHGGLGLSLLVFLFSPFLLGGFLVCFLCTLVHPFVFDEFDFL